MTWGSPWFFLAFLILPLMIWQYLRKEKKPVPTVTYPLAQAFVPLMKSPKRYLRHLPFVLRFMAVAFIIVALARPRLALDEEKVHTQGIDLIIAIDISTSMLAEDLDPDNRLEAAKMVAKEFISGRESDRIGLVMFAGEAFTWLLSPSTMMSSLP